MGTPSKVEPPAARRVAIDAAWAAGRHPEIDPIRLRHRHRSIALDATVAPDGQTQTSMDLLTRSLDEAAASGKPRQSAWANAFLGRAHVVREEWTEARPALERAIDVARSAGWMSFVPYPQSSSTYQPRSSSAAVSYVARVRAPMSILTASLRRMSPTRNGNRHTTWSAYAGLDSSIDRSGWPSVPSPITVPAGSYRTTEWPGATSTASASSRHKPTSTFPGLGVASTVLAWTCRSNRALWLSTILTSPLSASPPDVAAGEQGGQRREARHRQQADPRDHPARARTHRRHERRIARSADDVEWRNRHLPYPYGPCPPNSSTPRTGSPGTTRPTGRSSRTSRSASTRAPRSASSGRTARASRACSRSWPASTTGSPATRG